MEINNKLKKYIKDKILPRYNANDNGHGIDHIMYVIDRSLRCIDHNDILHFNIVSNLCIYGTYIWLWTLK